MVEFVSKSGAEIVINMAPWLDAKRLKAAIEKEAAVAGVKLDDLKADVSVLISTALSVDSSEAVDAALWACLVRCTRNKEKITPATFNTEEGRQDYYEIMLECLKVNFSPLFGSLLSVLPEDLLAAMTAKKAESAPPQ